MKKYIVDVCRTSYSTATFTVEAENAGEASSKAIEKAENHDFGTGNNADYSVESIKIA